MKKNHHLQIFRMVLNWKAVLLLCSICCTLGVSAQNVTLQKNKMTVLEVFNAIESQTNMTLAYSGSVVDVKRVVKTSTLPQPLSAVLKSVLANTGATYRISGHKILIIKDAVTPTSPASGQRHKYTGVIRDSKNQPLMGATIIVKGTSIGTTTDANGKFSISASVGNDITVSFIGYKEKIVRLASATTIDVMMEDDSQTMSEVVVVGYGSMAKRNVTSAIGTYKPGDINTREVLGVDALLQGRVSGVNITSASGVPGSKNRVSIRGIGSITASNEPLYVIDGVPISNTSGDTGAWGSQSMNGLDDFNPADIESVQVLKDAASAAIYGSRATNGVILITTKKGLKGSARVSVDVNVGFSNLTRTDKMDMANTELMLEVLNEGIDNYNIQTNSTQSRIDNPAPGKAQTNWLDLVLRTAVTYTANASISGATDFTDYYISGGFKHNEGVIIDNLLKRYNFKVNVNSNVKKWLKVGTSVNLSYSRNNRVPTGYNIGTSIITRALEQQPWDSPYRPNGEYAVGGVDLANHNPIQAIKEEDVHIDNYRLLGSAYAQFNITDELNFKTTLGEDFNYTEEYVYYTDQHPYGNKIGKLTDGRRSYASTLWENVLSYKHSFYHDLSLDVMLGHSIQKNVSSSASQTGIGFPSPSFDVNSVAAEFSDVSTGLSCYVLQSFFGRVNLNYKDRYVLTGTMRADGSSKFAPSNRYGYFPSVSGGWNISEESWWSAPQTDVKLRASWGCTGNQSGIGSYAYLALAGGGYSYNGESGLGLPNAGNHDLQWEKAAQTDIGLDLSFFNGRVTFAADAFLKDTKNLLYNKPTPATSGYTSNVCNIGSMRNKGLEFTLGANLSAGDFSWHSDFNISFIKNKLTALLGDDKILTTDAMHALKVGEEVGSFYMIKWDGIYQSDKDVPENLYAEGVRAGDCIYANTDGQGTIDANDKQFVGSANPKFAGGFNNTFKYKGIDLSIFLTYSYGNSLCELWTGGLRMGNGTWPILKSAAQKRWTGPGTTNSTPRAIYGYTWNSTKFVNSRMLHDASYLRCRTASIGYTLPRQWTQRMHIDNLRLFFQVDNLFVITDWPYLDPEVNVSLSATNLGYDYLYPSQPRTFLVGLNLKF